MFYIEQFYDSGNFKLKKWSRSEIVVTELPMKPYCFVRGKDELKLKDAIDHSTLMKIEFNTTKELVDYKYTHETWESDIPYERRIMLDMNWKIDDVPICYLDIETSDMNGIPDAKVDPILCIGMIFDDGREVWLSGDEKKIIEDFMTLTERVGIILTYNGGEDVYETRAFDMPYIAQRYAILFNETKKDFDFKMRHCKFYDLYQIYKFERSRVGKSLAGGWGLDNVAKTELGIGKIPRTKKICEMSLVELREYNMHDVKIMQQVDQKYHFMQLKIGLAQLTNLQMVGWNYKTERKKDELRPLIMIDNLLLKYARKLGLVLPNRQYYEEDFSVEGAMVIQPQVGIYHGVQNYDVVQMYPNIMIHEQISPDKEKRLVPSILKDIMTQRKLLKEKYEQTKSLEDYITQYNYKVLANVFYGAFGNKSSRLFDAELANRVTAKGRRIIQQIKELVESMDLKMLYGDTDSSFVQVEKEVSESLRVLINKRISPYEVELGEYYKSILFTGDYVGGKIEGKKKRYAGIIDTGEVKTVGLESIKRDYCVMARLTQEIFLDKLLRVDDLSAINTCLTNLKKVMRTGMFDHWLVITKGVKPLETYKLTSKTGKEMRGQPHIRAYKKALALGYKHLHDISFVYTTDTDVEPVLTEELPKNLDYDLYWDRQIYGVVENIMRSVLIQRGEYTEQKKRRTKKVIDSLPNNLHIPNTRQETLSV